jgi:predicted nucleic acid-binding protein
MTLLVDTSVWSLALRRNGSDSIPEVIALRHALDSGEAIVTTGIILQELLQGFAGPRDRNVIVERFAALPLLRPDRQDHIDAAAVRNQCRRAGVQIGTIDALLAQLCIRHQLVLLTTDQDFRHAAGHCSLKLWNHLRTGVK